MRKTSRPGKSAQHVKRGPARTTNRSHGISRRQFLTVAGAVAAGTAGATQGLMFGLRRTPMGTALAAAAAQTGGTLVYAVDQPVTKLDPNLDSHRVNQIVFFQIFD